MRLASAIASSASRGHDDRRRWPTSDCCTMSRPAAMSRRRRGRRARRGGAPGDKIDRASGSCSAWATRSAAIHSARPRAGDDDDLGRAGVEIDGAVGRDARLGGRDVAVAGPDDLVDARQSIRCRRRARRSHVRRRPGTGCVTPASSAAAITAGSGRGQTDDDFAHAGDARRDRGHQQRRGQRKPAARHVAADAAERLDPLLDRDAGHDLEIPVLRESAGRRRARCCGRPGGSRGAHRRARVAAAAVISSRETSSGGVDAVEPLARSRAAPRSPPRGRGRRSSATRRSNDRSAARSRASTRDRACRLPLR